MLTFSNNGKLKPPGTMSIKSAIVSSDSNTAAGNRSAIRLFSRGRLMELGGGNCEFGVSSECEILR